MVETFKYFFSTFQAYGTLLDAVSPNIITTVYASFSEVMIYFLMSGLDSCYKNN